MLNIKKYEEFINYHLDNKIPITESIFRSGSDAFYETIKEARKLFESSKIDLCDLDKELFESTDIGKFEIFEGEIVPLDIPMITLTEINEATHKGKEVKLNYPMRGGAKKYHVYVKTPKGNIKKISFGDVHGGLTAKVSDPKARKCVILCFSKRRTTFRNMDSAICHSSASHRGAKNCCIFADSSRSCTRLIMSVVEIPCS